AYQPGAHPHRGAEPASGAVPPEAARRPGPRPGVGDPAATDRRAAAHLLARPGTPDHVVRCGMTEITRRAVLGGAASGALVGALPADAALAEDDDDGFVKDRVDWPRFLAAADLIWQRMPTTWFEGPFLGNGFLGSGIYAEPGANAVRFNVQHSQVQDHRPEFGSLFGLARLPIGFLTLEPVGAITAIDWRLDVWNAELTGTITTAA